MNFRKIKKLVGLYGIPIIVGIISIFLFYNFFGYFNLFSSADLLNFRVQLMATSLGVLLSIAIINASDSKKEYIRIKRSFGLLKLIVIPLLKNQAENIRDIMNNYKDICSLEKAIEFLAMASRLDTLALASDKNWTQLIYSREFLDAPIKDVHFNVISQAILEQLLFIKTLFSQSNNSNLVPCSPTFIPVNLTDDQKELVITRAKGIRNDLHSASVYLLKYIENMDREVLNFLRENGVNYSEVDR